MQLGKVFKAAAVTFKENRAKIVTFALSLGIFASVVYILLDLLLGIGLLGLVFLILPLLTSVQYIARKCVNREEVNSSDFYLGYKIYSQSLFLQMKTYLRGFLVALVGFLVGAFIMGLILYSKALVEYPEYFSAITDYQVFYDKLFSIPWMRRWLAYASYVAFFLGGLSYSLFGFYNHLGPYICFETRFSINTAMALSKKYSLANKKFFSKFGLAFLFILVPMVALGIILNELLYLAGTTNVVAHCSAFLLTAILMAVYLFYYEISYYHIYRHYFQKAVLATYKRHMETLMGVNKAEEVPLDVSGAEDEEKSEPPFKAEDFNDQDEDKKDQD